jgi:AP2-associated kinase
MRRGRPTTTPQSHVSKPSPSPLRGINGDPFAALDSNVPASVATDDVAARFPSLDQFSLLHDHGAKFEFDSTSTVTASKPKDLNQRVTEKLADDAFVTPPPASGMSRAQKIISSSPALQEAVFVPSAVQQPTPNRPKMVSEGTMTSPVEPPSDPILRKYTPSPIHRFSHSDHHRSSSLPRNQGLASSGNRNLRPDDTYLSRDSTLPVNRSFQSQPISHTRHASSSRPSLEGGRPSIDFLDPVARTQPVDARPRPVTTYLESNMDYLRERESTASRPGFLSRQKSCDPNSTEAAVVDESNAEEESNIESNVDFLRTMEDQEAARRKDRRTSSGNKQAKRSSLPSLSGTKTLLAGKFGDAFKRFENNTSTPRTPSPQALDRRELTPIAGSEATDGRSDDGQVFEETDDMPPEMRRELERRRLSMEEKRVADAAAEYRKRLADRDASGAPKPIGGITKAASIQQKVKTLLDENQKPSPTKKTAEGYGRYTDGVPLTQARTFEDKPANPYPKPAIARKPVMAVGSAGPPPNPRPHTIPNESSAPFSKPRAPIATIPPAAPISASTSLPHRSTTVSTRPSAPPKPTHLNSIPTGPSAGGHTLSSSPPKPSATITSRRIEPRPDMTPAEKEDYIADFSKRFPSLSGIEMVETVVGVEGNGNGGVKTKGA